VGTRGDEATGTDLSDPNAERLVCSRILANVLVMTATKRLMSQKLSVTRQAMKYSAERKYSLSCMLNMIVVHVLADATMTTWRSAAGTLSKDI
jgi:hypothetical protein